MQDNPKKPSGLLHNRIGRDNFKLTLHPPSPELDLYIEHFWIVRWDLRGRPPYRSENLPHPSVHLVLEEGKFQIYGIVMDKFARVLKDKGFVFGIKFRPGAFYPFARVPVDRFTDRILPADECFGAGIDKVQCAILSGQDEKEWVAHAERFLLQRLSEGCAQQLKEPDDNVVLIKTMMDEVAADRGITSVEEWANRFHMNKRTLQRIFAKYVGIRPKWVIRRYRLLEAADRLAGGAPQDWTQLALKLGYYDQSHLIRDFKSIVGMPPDEYASKA